MANAMYIICFSRYSIYLRRSITLQGIELTYSSFLFFLTQMCNSLPEHFDSMPLTVVYW